MPGGQEICEQFNIVTFSILLIRSEKVDCGMRNRLGSIRSLRKLYWPGNSACVCRIVQIEEYTIFGWQVVNFRDSDQRPKCTKILVQAL